MNRLGERILIAAAPTAVYGLFMIIPVFIMLEISVSRYSTVTGFEPGYTFATYSAVLTTPFYWHIWLSTLEIAAKAALVATVVGTLAAFAMWHLGGRARSYLTVLVIAPLFVNSVARAYGWIAVIGPAGALPKLTSSLGMGEISFIFNERAVLIGFAHVFLPFVVVAVLIRLDTIKPSVLRAAAASGASPVQSLRRVVLPLAAPAIVGAFVLCFALASASYVIPAILGGGRVQTVAKQIVTEQSQIFDLPRAAALAVLLCLGTFLVFYLLSLFRRLTRRPLPTVADPEQMGIR